MLCRDNHGFSAEFDFIIVNNNVFINNFASFLLPKTRKILASKKFNNFVSKMYCFDFLSFTFKLMS